MDIGEALSEVDRLKARIDANRPISIDIEHRVFQKFKLDWNYHSNAIEGNSLTFGETKAFIMHGLTAKGKPFKDYLDIRGHDQVIDVLEGIVQKKEELTEVLIRELHKILLGDSHQIRSSTPDGLPLVRNIKVGEYKSADNHVITSTGQTHYFASAAETPARMGELIASYRRERDSQQAHPVAMAAAFHHQFVAIHPFDDGNGRMARILMNLILMSFGYLPAIIKLDDRAGYFSALEHANDGDLAGFTVLIAQSVIESQEILLRAVEGKPIDDLGDFDKKLSLIRQAIETEGGPDRSEKTQEKQNFLMSGLVAFVFNAVGRRFQEIKPLFAVHDCTILFQSGGVPSVFSADVIFGAVESMVLASSTQDISRVQLFYHAKGFIKDTAKDFMFVLTTYFNLSGFSITTQATTMHEHEIFRDSYSAFPGDEEGQDVAKKALGTFVSCLEKVVSA